MVTRAIDPLVPPTNTSVPGARNAAPTAITAQMATMTAQTRQKVSLRRMRRRSTIVSASSDMAQLSSIRPPSRLTLILPSSRPAFPLRA